MELFNKIGELARQTATKANDALEISKLNAKIRAEKHNIDTLKIQLGEMLWNQFNEGGEVSEEAKSLCENIKECNDAIDALGDAIASIREDHGAGECCCGDEACHSDPNEKQCTSCGAGMPKSSRFCGHCGAMQEE